MHRKRATSCKKTEALTSLGNRTCYAAAATASYSPPEGGSALYRPTKVAQIHVFCPHIQFTYMGRYYLTLCQHVEIEGRTWFLKA